MVPCSDHRDSDHWRYGHGGTSASEATLNLATPTDLATYTSDDGTNLPDELTQTVVFNSGLIVSWGATTGHTIGDFWDTSVGTGVDTIVLSLDSANSVFAMGDTTDAVNGTKIVINDINQTLSLDALKVSINTLAAYDDDAAAGGAGLITGNLYQTTGAALPPLNVPGIVMVKQ